LKNAESNVVWESPAINVSLPGAHFEVKQALVERESSSQNVIAHAYVLARFRRPPPISRTLPESFDGIPKPFGEEPIAVKC
jgi:hypothetical protein